ncbi:MAG TPA: hypothetical protein PKC45_04940 [Gemmatales bacterium]|nr:hypothetical protein [Gemmatales bacterium]
MNCRRVLLGLAIALLVTAPVLAQDPPRRGGPGQGQGRGQGMSPFGLLNEKAIQQDLGLTEDQVKKLESFTRDNRPPRFEPGGDREEMRARMEEFQRTSERELGNILNADQMKRFKQLRLQSTQRTMGLGAVLRNPEVAQAIDVSDVQRESMRNMGEEMQEMMREMRENQVGPQEMMEKMQELRKSMDEKIEKLLTDDQKAKLKEMMGEPFKGEFPRPGMPRRPGGN